MKKRWIVLGLAVVLMGLGAVHLGRQRVTPAQAAKAAAVELRDYRARYAVYQRIVALRRARGAAVRKSGHEHRTGR